MKCSCGNNVDERWNFCPHCGKKIERGFRLQLPSFNFSKKEDAFENMEDGMEEQMREMNQRAEQMLKAFGLPGKVNIKIIRHGPEGDVPVQIRPMQAQPVQRARKAPENVEEAPREIEETLEPLTKVTKSAKGTKVVMKLPGVRTVNDIKIRQLGESIEVKAYAGKRCYFKVIPIKPNSEISDKKFADEMLKLVIS